MGRFAEFSDLSTGHFFTQEYCAILLALAENSARKPLTVLQEVEREVLIVQCEAWLNAHCLEFGEPHLAVSGYNVSQSVN